MSSALRNHALALARVGYMEAPPLTVGSTDGEIPQGRELSMAWLVGTILTGVSSVVVMGAALFVSFEGQDTFSTAFEALRIAPAASAPGASSAKTSRVRATTPTRSELEIVEAAILETVDGRDLVKTQPFVRIRATLATAATALAEDIPAYDPQALIESAQPIVADRDTSTAIYGISLTGEMSIKSLPLSPDLVPARGVTDQGAETYVRRALENFFAGELGGEIAGTDGTAGPSLRDLGVVDDGGLGGVAENVSVVPMTGTISRRAERIVTVREPALIDDLLRKNGFTTAMIEALGSALTNVFTTRTLARGARLRILMGEQADASIVVPYRLSFYSHDATTGVDEHRATVARTDRGGYVLAQEPPRITFPPEDTEEINPAQLPSVYRAIWETTRKHDIDDATAKRIVAMYAYDVDLTRRIAPGDSIEILQTEKEVGGGRNLLYVGLTLGQTLRGFYRFRAPDGTVDFFDPDGQTGKRFLTRRPVQGGGRVASRFGYRVHPIFRKRALHTGVDLAAPRGTAIYASGDGVVEKAQWLSGYGRYVEIRHANGYETAYGHMSRIADAVKPGTRVRQGQVVGYVGSTGNSTGNHLHFEIKVNGRFVDPLSVKLPRDQSVPAQQLGDFKRAVVQIDDLLRREPAPTRVATAG